MNKNVTYSSGNLHPASWINLLGGIWFIIAPFIFVTVTQGVTNGVIVGIIVAILAIVRMSVPHSAWASWINGILGLWMIIAPWALRYSSVGSYWSNVIVGVIVAIVGFSTAGAPETPRHA